MDPNSEGWETVKQFSSVRNYCGPQATPSLTSNSQLLLMAEALSRLIPNADCSLFVVIRHRLGMIWNLDTALRGAYDRLALILMTTLVTGLGLVPLATGSGDPGREIDGPRATVILGGLVTSTASISWCCRLWLCDTDSSNGPLAFPWKRNKTHLAKALLALVQAL